MKLFYSYMERLRVHLKNVISLYLSLTPAIIGHKLVYVRQVLFALPFCFIMLSYAQAQSPIDREAVLGTDSIKSLKIGDVIPEILWLEPLHVTNHPSGKDTITLNDYRNRKLIILDFWATWCGSCVGSIKKFVETKDFKNPELAYFGVTYQDKEEIKKFGERTDLHFPSIFGDSVLRRYFPHVTLPHLVIIKDGRILATTGPEVLEGVGIRNMMGGTVRDFDIKEDILDFDPSVSFHEQVNENVKQAVLFRSSVIGPIAGMSSINTYSRDSAEQKILITAKSYMEALYLLLDSYWHNRIFFEVEDRSKLDYFNAYQGELSFAQWINRNGLGVEAHAPLKVPREKLFYEALSAVGNSLGLFLRFEERELECYLLTPNDTTYDRRNKKGPTLSDLLYTLNYQKLDRPRSPIFVVREGTDLNLSSPVDLSKIERCLSDDLSKDDSLLAETLDEHGWGLKKVYRTEPVIVVRERRQL